MRKNLTISLSPEDWRKVQELTRSSGGTYSQVFHKLIEAGTSDVCDRKSVEKYRALLAPHAGFLAGRAAALSKARKRNKASA